MTVSTNVADTVIFSIHDNGIVDFPLSGPIVLSRTFNMVPGITYSLADVPDLEAEFLSLPRGRYYYFQYSPSNGNVVRSSAFPVEY